MPGTHAGNYGDLVRAMFFASDPLRFFHEQSSISLMLELQEKRLMKDTNDILGASDIKFNLVI